MKRDEFEQLVMKAVEDLPEVFKDKLDNVDIVVENGPPSGSNRVVDEHYKRLVLGLYQGVPLSERTHYYGMVMPDKISIFKKNIERVCRTDQDVVRLVSHTIQHELAHHFGISDQRLRDLGIY